MGVFALALSASVAWGASDFLGGLAARSIRLTHLLAGSQLAALLVFAPVLLIVGAPAPDARRLLLGVSAGVIGVAELGLIYTALRRGPAVVIAPIAALGAVLPVIAGILGGERVDMLLLSGIAAALGGSVAASWVSGAERPAGREALLGAAVAGGAAIGVGIVLTLIDAASKGGAWWAIGAARLGGAVTALGVFGADLLLVRPGTRDVPSRPAGRAALAIAAVGVSDLAADVAFANATRGGALSVVAVLASLSPLTTIGLGVVVLEERPGRVQSVGAALACLGVAVLSVRAG